MVVWLNRSPCRIDNCWRCRASVKNSCAWKAAPVLRVELQRVLRDGPDADAPAAPAPAAPAPIAPARTADLLVLVRDTDTGIRRRAALAIGRVGRPEAIGALSAAVGDDDTD